MARPALIIGLGGTGQSILRFLKKDLLEIGEGRMPPGVRLLAFDTTRHPMAQTGQKQKKDDDDDDAPKLAGSIGLEDKTEFIHYGRDLKGIVREINEGKHPHLNWFTATQFLKKLSPAVLNADDGAGAIRHIGRMCLIQDVENRQKSKIISNIERAITDIASEVSKERRDIASDNHVEVIIVGSMAGGTGASLLVDMPIIVRNILDDNYAGRYVIRGLFVTPRAFREGVMGDASEMMARSFAAWRELDRFLITSSEFGANKIIYSSRDQELQLVIPGKPYDVTYIIDPNRPDNPLRAGHPNDGLFPSVANAISAMLDDIAGEEYSAQAINLNSNLSHEDLRPYHSAIGSYTMKVPVYYARQKFTYSLAREALDIFLAPEIDEHDRVVRLKETANREVSQGEIGMQAVVDFLNADSVTVDGNPIPNTLFTKLIAKVRTHDGQSQGNLIKAAAQPGLTRKGGEYLLALTQIGQDESGKLIANNINRELTMQVWDNNLPSRDFGDHPQEAIVRLTRGVERTSREHYGMDVVGERLRGLYGNALEEAKYAQLDRFGKLLRAWTENTLNGTSVNASAAKGGKLGYVRAFYGNLVDALVYFEGFIDKVNKMRAEELKLEEHSRSGERAALKEYESNAGKQCFFTFWDGFTHPDAHRAQRNYLQAAQRVVNVRKDGILLNVLEETSIEMRGIVEKTLEDLDTWVMRLATGNVVMVKDSSGETRSEEMRGLYMAIVDEQGNLEVNHALDKQLISVSRVLGEHSYESSPEFVEEVLKSLQWEVERDETGYAKPDGNRVIRTEKLRMSLKAVFPIQEGETKPREEHFINKGETALRDNLAILSELAQRPYSALVKSRPFAVEIQNLEDANTGTKLGNLLDKKAEPFYQPTPVTFRLPVKPSALIRVDSGAADNGPDYFGAFVKRLSELDASVSFNLVDSKDRHKMTIVRMNDLIRSEDFQIWQNCREAYLRVTTDPSSEFKAAELHIFPAEINACRYEEKMSIYFRRNIFILDPRVVSLLEDDQKIEMFFRALALGFIAKSDEGTWQLDIGDGNVVQLGPSNLNLGQSNEPSEYFVLINQFVVRGVDFIAERAQRVRVDYSSVVAAIRRKHQELGKSKVTKIYESAKNGEMVGALREYVTQKRREIASDDHHLKNYTAKDYEDLADLAEVIYDTAAKSGQ